MFGLFTKDDMQKEMQRRNNQKLQILIAFKRHKTRHTGDLIKLAPNYTMRVSELRKAGHKIEAEYVRPGVWKYSYMGYNSNLKVA